MTLLVPFDGSELAEAALVRAIEFSIAFDEEVLAVAVIPKGNTSYAREKGWLDADERFDLQSAVSSIHNQVTDLCPSANFRYETVGRDAAAGAIASRIRKVAKDRDAAMVFIGSENAGRIVSSVSSVGRSIALDDEYDVVIVRERSPAKIKKLKNASPHRRSKSEFYR
jgi:nucleotide-binding universal stress UspA family protein